MVEQLNYKGIEFPVATKHYAKIEEQTTALISTFSASKTNNEDVLNPLLITKDEKKHYVLMKDFNSLMFSMNIESIFACIASTVLVVKRYLPNIRLIAW